MQSLETRIVQLEHLRDFAHTNEQRQLISDEISRLIAAERATTRSVPPMFSR